MTRAVVFLLATFVAWSQLGAQANSSSSPARAAQEATDNSAQHTVTVTGCLYQSQANGGFTLIDTRGREFLLAGHTDSLAGHSKQEIQVTGQQSFSANSERKSSTPTSEQRSESQAGASGNQIMIEVTETKIVSDHCSSPAGAGEKPSAEASDPAAGDEHSLSSPQSPGGARLLATAVRLDEAATDGGRELPQTSTILPLLGLIGLGSLVAGFFARR